MKEAIGGTWIYGIVLLFITVFTCFVSVSTNYSRCFKIKDEIILTLEHYHGINEKSIKTINEYLTGIGYSSTGKCPDDGNKWYKFSAADANRTTGYGGNTNYCITKHNVVSRNANTQVINGPIGHPDSAYYGVVVFFRLDWPIFRQFFNITISGETGMVYLPKDSVKYIDE